MITNQWYLKITPENYELICNIRNTSITPGAGKFSELKAIYKAFE